MELRSIDVYSCARICGVLYAAIGLLIGGLMSIFAILFSVGSGSSMLGFGGVAAVIAMPVVYGGLGALSGAVVSLLYNVVARNVGGIRLELVDRDAERQRTIADAVRAELHRPTDVRS